MGTADRSSAVFVFVGERAATDAQDRLLLAEAAVWLLGPGSPSVTTSQRCERCSGSHGRPVVVLPAGAAAAPPHVSLSRAGGTVAVAVTFAGPVGVDIESITAASRASFDDVAFGADETLALLAVAEADADWTRAAWWTRKEAALKAAGVGLRVDPRELTVSLPRRDSTDAPTLEAWPAAPVPVSGLRLEHLEPGPDLVGTVAVLGGSRPQVRLLPASRLGRHPLSQSSGSVFA